MKKFLALCFALLFTLALLPNVPFKPHQPAPAKPLAYAEGEISKEVEEDEIVESLVQPRSDFVEYYSAQTKLCVVGEASKVLVPDRGVVYAIATGFGKDCKEAKDEAFEVFDRAVEVLEANGCDKGEIVIENFYSHPCRDCHNQGCHGNLSFSFVIQDLSKTDDIISSVLEGGVEEISSICYEVSNIDEEYNALLSEALENAKTKASKLLGDDLQLVDIREQSVYYSNCLYRDYVSKQENFVGGIEVKTRVEATFI